MGGPKNTMLVAAQIVIIKGPYLPFACSSQFVIGSCDLLLVDNRWREEFDVLDDRE